MSQGSGMDEGLLQPQVRPFHKGSVGVRIQTLVGWIAFVGFVVTLAIVNQYVSDEPCTRPLLLYAFAAGWAVLPPIWAWIEFFYVYPRPGWGGVAGKDSVDLLKHGMQLRLALWAPIAIALGTFSTSDFFKDIDTTAGMQHAANGQVAASSETGSRVALKTCRR